MKNADKELYATLQSSKLPEHCSENRQGSAMQGTEQGEES